MASEKTSKKPVKRGVGKPKRASAKPKAVSTVSTEEVRHIKPPKKKLFRRQDKRFRQVTKIPSSWKITKKAYCLLRNNWKLIGGIVLVYGILNVILVHGLNGGTDVTTLKQDVNQVFKGGWGHLAGGFTIFGLLLTSSSSTASDIAGAYQSLLIIVVSLAIVWTLRQLFVDNAPKIRIRDGFYQGMYPLIPVVLVMLVIVIQLLPLLAGVWLYSILNQGGIAITELEKFLTFVILIVLSSITLYMLCSSLFALYIVTLPNMTPLKALRSARRLAKYRRWSILRKALFLPFFLVIIGAAIMLPFILFLTPIAQWAFFVLTVVVLAVVHAYMYVLYRELLNEPAKS